MDGENTADELRYATELPAGYRFRPSDEELMTYYLCNKVLDRPVPGRVVQNIDANALYSNSPDIVVTHATASSSLHRDEREWYFFLRHGSTQQDEKQGEQEHEQKRVVLQDENEGGQQQQQQQEHQAQKQVVLQDENVGEQQQQQQEQKQVELLGENQINQDLENELDKEIDQVNQINEDVQIEFDKEKVRIVGDGIGFWKSIGKEDPIYDADGKAYGFKVHFSYFKGCTSKYRITHWMMDEYHVTSSSSQWVLVRIRRGRDYSGN